MIATHIIHDDGCESLDIVVRVTPDPTGGSASFALSTKGVNTPGAWSAGVLGSWDSTTKHLAVLTPTIGASALGATLPVTAGNTYWLWYRIVVGTETFVDVAAIIVCP
jgi:hypothetical protein